MKNQDILGARIRESRERMDMTQRAFSELLHVSQQALSYYESGATRPSLETMKTIASTCNVSLDWLCGLRTEAELNREQLKNYGELIELLFMIESSHVIFDKITKEACQEKEHEFVPILIQDRELKLFVMQWSRMTHALHQGIIDQISYDIWQQGILNKYSVMPLELDE